MWKETNMATLASLAYDMRGATSVTFSQQIIDD